MALIAEGPGLDRTAPDDPEGGERLDVSVTLLRSDGEFFAEQGRGGTECVHDAEALARVMCLTWRTTPLARSRATGRTARLRGHNKMCM